MATEQPEDLTISDFARYDWQDKIAASEAVECFSMFRLFDELFGQTPETDIIGRGVFKFLARVSCGSLDCDATHEPFRAIFSGWPTPDDIPDEHVHLLPELAPLTRDPELRARIADVAWLRARHYQSALLAVSSYLESARRLDKTGSWIHGLERVERALRIAAQFRRSHGSAFDDVVAHIEGELIRIDPVGQRWFQPARMMELLIELRTGDKKRWSTYAEELAERAEREHDLDRAKDYWTVKAAWEHVLDNEAGRKAAEIRAAEVQVTISNSYLVGPNPDYLSSATQLQMAIEMFRQVGARERAEDLRLELANRDRYGYQNMKTLKHSVDISKYVDQSESAVRGKDFPTALVILARLVTPPKLDWLRQRALETSEEVAFAHLFSVSRVDGFGRVVANKPSLHSSDPAEVEKATLAEMFNRAAEYQRFSSQAFIWPARALILREHSVRERDISFLIDHNPLIPFGHHQLVSRGLYAGLIADFPVAVHLLVPQLEQSIRWQLNACDVTTTSMASDGVQEELDLTRLLAMPITSDVFGAELVFDLRGLLVERFGSNYRNLLAHGLLNYWDLAGSSAEYLWWLALRFYSLPTLARIAHAESTEANSDTSDPSTTAAAE